MENSIEEVFNAFQGGYCGPSYFYYINKVGDGYKFRYGYSRDGMFIKNTSDEAKLCDEVYSEEYYHKFINKILELVKDWKEECYNSDILDGTQWHIKFLEYNKKYTGSNNFPANYEDVMSTIRKFFNVKPSVEEIKHNEIINIVNNLEVTDENLKIEDLDNLFKD